MEVERYHNFAVDLGNESGVFVHNCTSVHAEQNAVISASRDKMLGATLYLVGFDAQTGEELPDAEPCLICRRMIANAGINNVVTFKTMHETKEHDQGGGGRLAAAYSMHFLRER